MPGQTNGAALNLIESDFIKTSPRPDHLAHPALETRRTGATCGKTLLQPARFPRERRFRN